MYDATAGSLTQQRPHPRYKSYWTPPVEAVEIPVDGRWVAGVEIVEVEPVAADDVVVCEEDSSSRD